VVTGDSVSMISEATATGRPVHVHHLPELRQARRLRRFHASFEDYGYTRRFTGTLDHWSYMPPNETERVAGVIRRRVEGQVAPVKAPRRAA
jgi:mitochondrial fission protein ELM1